VSKSAALASAMDHETDEYIRLSIAARKENGPIAGASEIGTGKRVVLVAMDPGSSASYAVSLRDFASPPKQAAGSADASDPSKRTDLQSAFALYLSSSTLRQIRSEQADEGQKASWSPKSLLGSVQLSPLVSASIALQNVRAASSNNDAAQTPLASALVPFAGSGLQSQTSNIANLLKPSSDWVDAASLATVCTAAMAGVVESVVKSGIQSSVMRPFDPSIKRTMETDARDTHSGRSQVAGFEFGHSPSSSNASPATPSGSSGSFNIDDLPETVLSELL